MSQHKHSDGEYPVEAGSISPWKLRMMRSVANPPEETPIELYDLSSDLGERNNLVEERPDKLRELLQDLAAWERDVGIASMTRTD